MLDAGALSRAEISRRTGMSKPTVSLAIHSLEASGLVAETGIEAGRPGRSGVLYGAVAEAVLSVGIEISVGRVRGVLVDLDGRSLAEHARPVRARTSRAAYDAVRRCVDALFEASGESPTGLFAVAVGTPGVIDPSTGRLTRAGTLPELDGTAPAEAISRRVGVPVRVINDVDLAALAEQVEGAGRGLEDFVVLWAGSGLGSAIVSDGALRFGHRGGAGEIHDIPFATVAAALGRGTSDEVDISFAGVTRLAARLAPEHPDSRLAFPYRADRVLDAADFDPLGAAVRERLATWVAWYCAALGAVVDPELIVLAGPLLARDDLVEPVGAVLAALLSAPPRVVASRLGDRALLAGAAAVARNEALDRAFVTRRRPQREP